MRDVKGKNTYAIEKNQTTEFNIDGINGADGAETGGGRWYEICRAANYAKDTNY